MEPRKITFFTTITKNDGEVFTPSKINQDQHYIKLINYVDDALYYCSDDNIRKDFEEALKSRFDLTLLGKAKWYLGMRIKQEDDYITLDQDQYVKNIITNIYRNHIFYQSFFKFQISVFDMVIDLILILLEIPSR